MKTFRLILIITFFFVLSYDRVNAQHLQGTVFHVEHDWIIKKVDGEKVESYKNSTIEALHWISDTTLIGVIRSR